MTKAITPRPRTHLASCAHCKAEARILHARTHLSPEALDQIRKTERAYAALEVEFEYERDAELATLARGIRPVPGQWKIDQARLATYPEPVPATSVKVDEESQPTATLAPALIVYRDLWHGEAAS